MNQASPPPPSLPRSLKLTWATGAFGVSILMNGIAALILFYLTVVVRLDAAVAGFLVFLSKLYDAVSDPISGWLSDRTKSAMGRRRPWLLGGAIVSAVSFVLVFTVPFQGPYETVLSGPGFWTCAYVLLVLLLYTTGYSLFNVPYMAMPAEMTTGYHERSELHGYRVMFASIGGLAIQVMAGFILEPMGKDRDAHAMLGIVGAAMLGIAMLIAFFGTARAPAPPPVEARDSFGTQVRTFFDNRAFQVILSVKLVQLIGIAASTGGLVFLLTRVLDRSLTLLPVIGGATVIGVLTSTPMLVALSKRIGKRGGYVVSAAVTGLTALSWTLAQPDEPVWALALRGYLLGIAFSGNVMFAMSMLTDAMEVDQLRTGLRREGMYSAFYSFIEKLAMAIGPLILGTALSYGGFDPQKPPSVVDEGVRQAVLLGIAYVPAAMAVIAVILLYFYRLDEAELARLRAQAAVRAAS